MGVNHLKMHAAQSQAIQVNNGAPDAVQISTPMGTRPAPTSGANNPHPLRPVLAQSHRALHAPNTPGQPEKNGTRAGMRSGMPPMGDRTGNGHPKSGGRLG